MEKSRDKGTAFSKTLSLQCADKLYQFEWPVVMGILNITPDSFFDGGRYMEERHFLARVEQMLEEGAGIIDIGAMSSRPGASDPGEEEELNRLIPSIDKILRFFPGTFISVDTYRSKVAAIAADHGALMVNDISGGNMDPLMFSTVAGCKLPYVLMHMQGNPENMQNQPLYEDVVKDIRNYFAERLNLTEQAGIRQVILDPGFGFGKTVLHNYSILKHLGEVRIAEHPLLVGLSRKSMIYKVTGTHPDEALHGTGMLHALSLIQGADILRVHDVKEAVQAIRIINMYQQAD